MWGRKDVGGIVGQFEPNAEVTYGDSPMDRLNDSLAALFDEMEVLPIKSMRSPAGAWRPLR